jgi:hypothetical protein
MRPQEKQEHQQMIVTRQALVLRINRRLEQERYRDWPEDAEDGPPLGWQLRKSRGRWEQTIYGEYYLFDRMVWRVRRLRVDLEALAREVGVLAAHEVAESADAEAAQELNDFRKRKARDARRAIRVVRARRRDPKALQWAHPSEDSLVRYYQNAKNASYLGRAANEPAMDDFLKTVDDARSFEHRLENITLLR